jgi:hypothetical protein
LYSGRNLRREYDLAPPPFEQIDRLADLPPLLLEAPGCVSGTGGSAYSRRAGVNGRVDLGILLAWLFHRIQPKTPEAAPFGIVVAEVAELADDRQLVR